MAQTLNTCSQVVSLAKELENRAKEFYLTLCSRFPDKADLFRDFAKDSSTYITNLERAYYGVISDAYEGCFAFSLDPEDYRIDTEVREGLDLSSAVAKALKMEEKLIEFYRTAAEQSKNLMADVPRAMETIAKKRLERVCKLKGLLENL